MNDTAARDGSRGAIAIVDGIDDLISRNNCGAESLSIVVGNSDLVGASSSNGNDIGAGSGAFDCSAILKPLIGVVGIDRIAIRISCNNRSN